MVGDILADINCFQASPPLFFTGVKDIGATSRDIMNNALWQMGDEQYAG